MSKRTSVLLSVVFVILNTPAFLFGTELRVTAPPDVGSAPTSLTSAFSDAALGTQRATASADSGKTPAGKGLVLSSSSDLLASFDSAGQSAAVETVAPSAEAIPSPENPMLLNTNVNDPGEALYGGPVARLADLNLGSSEQDRLWLVKIDGVLYFHGYDEQGNELFWQANDSDLRNSVPEPGTWLLLGTGLTGVVGYTRRISRKKAS